MMVREGVMCLFVHSAFIYVYNVSRDTISFTPHTCLHIQYVFICESKCVRGCASVCVFSRVQTVCVGEVSAVIM